MKKNLKKSLSLFLAVLMMLSCWVWVAPQKAEAYLDVSYSATIVYDVDNTAENGGHAIIYYYPFNDDGTLNTSTMVEYTPTNNTWGSLFHEENGTTGVEVTLEGIPGWPCKFFWQVNGKGANNYNVRITKLKINTVTVATYTGGYLNDDTAWNKWDQTRNFIWQWDGKGASDSMISSRNWSKPTFTTITSIETKSAGTIGKLPNGAPVTTTGSITGGKDQYGVSLHSYYFPTSGVSYSIKDGNGADLNSTYATVSGSGSTATIKINDDAQKLFPDANGGTLYLYATYGSSTVSSGFKFDNPEYTITFDANGGKIGADDSTAAYTVTLGGTDSKKYYDTVIGKSPVYRAKAGFEFKGFYSTKNADATGKTASFNGIEFEDGVTKVDANGDTTWYAAWQALPITATFVTQDGQLIGTVKGRYNNNMTASNMYNGDTGLNAAVKAAYTGNTIQFNGNNEPIYTDGSTTYKFAGWKIIKAYDESVVDGNEDTVLQGDVTFQAVYTKATAATYTVKFKNAEGVVISEKSGYKYRDQVTNVPATDPTKATDDRYEYKFIGWAKDIGKNFYVVDEYDDDENGARIVYTHKDAASFVVKGDASYAPVFRMVPREYSVTFNYTVDGGTSESVTVDGYHWGDTPEMPEIKDNYTNGGFRYYLIGWKKGTDSQVNQLDEITVEDNMSLTAVYGNAEAAKYTINFYGKDADGVTDILLNGDKNIYEHGSPVTAPEVPQIIDTEDALYTFAGWSPAVNTTAGGDVDYYATYTKKTYADLHFYNYDGTLIYETMGKENSLFVDETIPAYTGETPVKEEDPVGTYNFTGWADSNGDPVVPGTDVFTGDTYLYAQFETVYKEYTVKFENEGVVISELKYHYGDEITVPADPTKAEDVEYIYDFKAWSPDVSEVCYGDATYEATYRRTPQYYKVTWFNDNKAVHSESNYKYNAKIQQAVINDPVDYPAPDVGKEWAFKEWIQCNASGEPINADGNVVDEENAARFVRGQKMGSEQLYFYPVFEEVTNVLTVTFYKEDGTSYLGEAKIPYGRDISEYAEAFAEKAPKAADETYHYVIEKWVNVNGGADVTKITADVSVKATYTATEHTWDVYDVTLEPTCNETGLANVSCSAAECDKTLINVVLDVIPDEGAPTGQIYVGLDKWTLKNFTEGIDYTNIKYVNPNTYVVVSAEDIGSRSRNNPDGILNRGVGKIDYYISETAVADPSSIGTWTNVYDYEAVENQVLNNVLTEKGKTMQDYIAMSTPNNKEKKAIDDEVKAILATYYANATGVLSNLNLVNGKEYIIYIRISDREVNGQSNKAYLSSGTISYGSEAAEIAVSGDGYGTKFCADATVTVTDDTDGYTVYLDGEEVALTDGKFTCDTAGVHTVTVVDKHGNKTTKTFEIKGNHTFRNYTTAATCENAGSRYDLCTVCGHKANVEVIPALGHSYTANFIDKAPDCINDGYRTYVCDNNCGTKLVLKPTDDAATIAQAKVAVDPEAEEIEWRDLTAVDLAHLKATGKHTYAKVKDEDGNDTAEDAWVIDKAATCSVKGSKHKDCIVCGIEEARVTEEIPLDTVNGHKFYREKVTKEPTCTETGVRSKTCRYCGEVVKTEDIDALGHVAGEYRVITDPKCDSTGSKILTCGRCSTDERKVDIGEPIKDADGKITGFDGKAVEIPELGHAWKIDGEVYSKEEVDKETGETITVWYQNYVCKNDSKHTKEEKLKDYQPPVAATVTFDFNGGSYVVPAVGNPNEFGYVPEMLKGTQTISTFVGESIIASDVETAIKQDTATYKYTFSHWATKNADGTYTAVKFPIEVKGDATYYAIYAEKHVNYTITYYKEDGTTEFKKTGYLHNGEEVTLAGGPAKAETNLVKYEFAGWQLTTGDTVYTDKVTINGANINLKATYKEISKQYAVTYAYSSSNQIHTYLVDAGTAAPDVTKDFYIEKAYDAKYHYTFKEWNRAAQLASVESNIYTTPNFDSAQHTYDHEDGKKLKATATCTSAAVYTYTCTCGYTYEKAEGSALEHIWGVPVYNEATGKNTVTCQREGCDVTQTDTRSFKAEFFVNAKDTQAIKTVYYIPWGTTIPATKLPSNPTKESTATTDYTFKGWATKNDDGTEDIVDFTKLEIKDDYKFVAVFEGTTRKYNVIFAYDAQNVIETHIDVEAGDDVTFKGKTPVKAYDANYHYTFSNWQGYAEGNTVKNVQSDLYILAEFSKAEHKYDNETPLKEATCTNGKGTRYSCDCGKYYDVTGKPLDHIFETYVLDKATGKLVSQCKNGCGTTDVKEPEDNDDDNTGGNTGGSDTPTTPKKYTLTIHVYENGNSRAPIANAQVDIYRNGERIATDKTGPNGTVAFVVDEGTYGVDVSGIPYQGFYRTDVKVSGNTSFNANVYVKRCNCACHDTGLWGTIFRFFHKIIKMITGEFKCCKDPSDLY